MYKISYDPFPILNTKRLKLRQLTPADEKEIYLLRSDPGVLEYIDRPACTEVKEAHQFINKITNGIKNNECVYWAINLKDDPKLIGTICLWNFTSDKSKADIGYELLPEYQGNGYMNEAIPAVLSYGFYTLQLNSIDGEVDPRNLKSVRLLEKFGFTLRLKPGENIDEEGNVLPTVIYSLSRREAFTANQ